MRPAEPQELDGNERPLLGGADQLRRQPQRGRISGADRLLRGLLSLRGDSSDVSLYCTGHLPRHLALLLHLHSGVPGARYIRHQGASDNRKPRFERVFRVQMNTLEWMPIFLPSLWLFAIYVSDPIAAAI